VAVFRKFHNLLEIAKNELKNQYYKKKNGIFEETEIAENDHKLPIDYTLCII